MKAVNGLKLEAYLQDDRVGSDSGQVDFVVNLESSVLGVNVRDSGHQASADLVSVLLPSLPRILG